MTGTKRNAGKMIALSCLLGLGGLLTAFEDAAAASGQAGGLHANVIDYGAVGDDSIDDSAAIQQAIGAVRAAGGGTVYVPAGTYLVSDLKLYSNTELRGEGWDSVLKQNSSAPGDHFVLSVNPGAEGLNNPQSNITIKNIKLMDKNGEGAGFAEHQHVLNLHAVSDLLVDHLNVTGFRGDGIYLGSGNVAGLEMHNTRVTIRNSYFDGVTKDNRNGVSFIDCESCSIENNEFVHTTRTNMPGAIDLEPNQPYNVIKNIAIRNNKFEDIGGNVGMIAVVLGRPQSSMKVPSENIVIENNQGKNLAMNARAITVLQRQSVEQAVANNVTIRNNSVVDSKSGGIGLFGVKGVTVENNHFSNITLQSYIGYSGSPTWDISLINNKFHDTGTIAGEGLNIYTTTRLLLQNNLFENVGREDGTKGYAVQFTPGQGTAIRFVNNKFMSQGRTTYAVKNAGFTFGDPSLNEFRNNKFIHVTGNDLPN